MDILQEYALQLSTLLISLEPYTRTPRSLLLSTYTSAKPLVLPYLDTLAQQLAASPSLLVVGGALLLLLIALQILSWIRRIMMFWFRVISRLVFYSALLGLAMIVYQRGIGRSVGDVMAFCKEVQEVWWREYERWDGYANANASGGGGRGGSVVNGGRGKVYRSGYR